MISLIEFTHRLEAEFEELEPGTLTSKTDYKKIKGWSSMHALIVIAVVDANFDVLLSGSDLKNTITVEDLYNSIQHKK